MDNECYCISWDNKDGKLKGVFVKNLGLALRLFLGIYKNNRSAQLLVMSSKEEINLFGGNNEK